MTQTGIAFMTASSREEAEKIARHLVEHKLAACVNVLAEVRSFYRWEGEVCDDPEVLLIAKTTAARFPELAQQVQELHSYAVPEVIFVPIQAGSDSYLKWIDQVTRS